MRDAPKTRDQNPHALRGAEAALQKHDPYGPQMAALKAIGRRTSKAKDNTERVALLVAAIKQWDTAKLGSWKDAVVVAGRRAGIASYLPYLLLAAVAGGIKRTTAPHTPDPNHTKRASEIGRNVEKLAGRSVSTVMDELRKAGGVKKLSDAKHQPARRPRIRKAQAS